MQYDTGKHCVFYHRYPAKGVTDGVDGPRRHLCAKVAGVETRL